jgi:hypothetical protein
VSTQISGGSSVHIKADPSAERWTVLKWKQGYMSIRPVMANGDLVSTDEHDEVRPPSELEHYDDYLARVAEEEDSRSAPAPAARPTLAQILEAAVEHHAAEVTRATLVMEVAKAEAATTYHGALEVVARMRLAEFDAEVDGSTTTP